MGMPLGPEPAAEPESAAGATAPALPANALPTLQRNALRKVFDRADFTPEDVAALGYRRLRRIEGIGEKGIRIIGDWLAQHGHVLAPEPTPPRRAASRASGGWTLQSAMRLLRIHGYEILAPANAAAPRPRKATPAK